MKQTFKGWAGKSGTWWFNKDKESRELMVYRTRGKRVEWDDDDWPPVRVKVTIETLPNAALSGGVAVRSKGIVGNPNGGE